MARTKLNSEEKKFLDQMKFGGEWLQYKLFEETREVFKGTPDYEEIKDKIEKVLMDPASLRNLVENLQHKKPIVPLIFAESKEAVETLQDNETIVRLILAESLKITPDMPEELVKELDELAEILTNDPEWSIRRTIAQSSDIEPNFFEKLAEKLKNDKDWRVIVALIENHNTPKEIRKKLEKENKELLKELKAMETLQALLRGG